MKEDIQSETWDKYWHKRRQKLLNRYYHDKPVNHVLELFSGNVSNIKILEIGAGSGVDIVQFAKLDAEAYALDYSVQSLSMVEDRAEMKKVDVHIINADAEQMPFTDAVFDVVYSLGVVEHFKNPNQFMAENVRVLKRGGYLLVDSPQPFCIHTIRKHILMHFNRYVGGWETQYTVGQLKKMLQDQGLDIVDSYARSYDLRPVLALRQLHKIGLGFIDEKVIYPILPPKMGILYDKIWSWFEKRKIAYYICWCVGVIGRKV